MRWVLKLLHNRIDNRFYVTEATFDWLTHSKLKLNWGAVLYALDKP